MYIIYLLTRRTRRGSRRNTLVRRTNQLWGIWRGSWPRYCVYNNNNNNTYTGNGIYRFGLVCVLVAFVCVPMCYQLLCYTTTGLQTTRIIMIYQYVNERVWKQREKNKTNQTKSNTSQTGARARSRKREKDRIGCEETRRRRRMVKKKKKIKKGAEKNQHLVVRNYFSDTPCLDDGLSGNLKK